VSEDDDNVITRRTGHRTLPVECSNRVDANVNLFRNLNRGPLEAGIEIHDGRRLLRAVDAGKCVPPLSQQLLGIPAGQI